MDKDAVLTMAEVVFKVQILVGPFSEDMTNKQVFAEAASQSLVQLSGLLRGANISVIGDPQVTAVRTQPEKKELT